MRLATKIIFAIALIAGLNNTGLKAQTVTNCPSTSVADTIVRSAPTIVRSSDTVDVNQIVQLFGDSMNSAQQQVTAMGWGISDTTVTAPQTSPAFNPTNGTCLTVASGTATTAKVLLPTSAAHSGGFGPTLGMYALQLGNPSGASSVWFLNRAEPWWVLGSINDTTGTIFPVLQGGTGDKVIPGQSFRVFGRNLFTSNQMQGWLQGNGLTCPLTYQLTNSNNWAASFQLPLSCGLPAGTYTLFVHNGLGGPYGFGKTLSVIVGALPPVWSSNTYNVRSAKYGAVGNGQNDDTAAFQAALNDAKAGGTVVVPPGTYLISSKLSIPPYSILQGSGSNQTQAVLLSTENGSTSVLAGNSNFNVQNLTIQTSTALRVITCPDNVAMYNDFGLTPPYPTPCSNVLVDHVTINHSTPVAAFHGSDLGNGSIHTYGNDITVQNSSITAQATAPTLLYSAHHVVINGNTLLNGDQDADGFFNADQITYENNSHSATPGTSGNSVYVEGTSHYIYVANNTIQNSFGTNGEGFVAGDTPYVPDRLGFPSSFHGGTNTVSDPATVTFANANWQTNQFANEVLYVISGKGALQRNYVASNTSDTLYLNSLWKVPLDDTSIVDLIKDHSDGIFYNNSFNNVSVSVQMYAQSYGFVVDNNTSTASGGSYCLGWNHTNAEVNGTVISTGGAYSFKSIPSASYGPVNLFYYDYSVPNGQPLIASQMAGTPRNDVSGYVGMKFTVGGTQPSVQTNQITVSQLGRVCLAGNSGTHVVKLVGVNGVDIAGGSATVSMAGCTPGQYVYANLPATIKLYYTTPYYLVSQETAGGDQWYDTSPVTPTSPFNLCYFNQWTNNHISGSLDSSNPNKAGATGEFGPNIAVLGAVLDPTTMNSPSPTNGYIPPIVGNEVRSNTLTAVGQGAGQGYPTIGGVYNVNQPSYYCAPILLPNGGATDTLVESNTSVGVSPPIWFSNLFGYTLLHNNSVQATPADYSFTNCSPLAEITTPAGGATVSGGIVVAAVAQAQASSIASVQFQADGANITNPVTAPPYQATIDTTALVNGTHFLSALSIDTSGRSMQSPTVEIIVNNGSSSGVTAPVISGVSVSVINTSSVNVSWTTDQVSDSEVFYGITASYSSSSPVNSNGVTSHSVILNGLSAGVTYHYSVTSKNSSGLSASSIDATFIISSSASSALLTSFQPGTIRNNFSGYVGFQFTTGSTGITVVSLGRVYLGGNSGTHTVKLVRASNGEDVAGGSVSIAMSGGTAGTFTYAQLSAPLSLAASTSYYLVSQEASGGDQWYDITPVVATGGVGTINGPVYNPQSQYIPVAGLGSSSYVPVNLQYTGGSGGSSSPVVTLTAPSTGATVSGAITLSANAVASTGFSIATLQFQIDGANVGSAFALPPYNLVFQTSTVSNGSHTLSAAATDTSGAKATSNSVVITVSNGGTSSAGAFVTSTGSASLRNNFSGWVGMEVTVGSAPMIVQSLGRIFVSGNVSNHTMKLVNAVTGQDVAGGSVTVSGGTPGQFTYANLASALTLAANTSYYLMSQEVSGGDQWYDYEPVTYTNAATVNGPVYQPQLQSYTVVSAPNYSYVPVNMQYTLGTAGSGGGGGGGGNGSGTPLLSGFSPGQLRNNYSGWVGMELTVGSTALTVNSLGRLCATGNSGVHTVKLIQVSNGADVSGGSAQVSTVGATAGQFTYASLANPVTLAANTSYYLVSQEVSGGDQWYNIGSVSSTGAGSILGPVYYSGFAYVLVGNLPNQSYLTVNLTY